MPLIIGYGEDALTYAALTERLPEFLSKLGDRSEATEAILLFRPSFGRSGAKSSPFGEFDAIVGTTEGVYLVEAKWSRSSEVWQPRLALRDEQVRRHKIFRWYLERWRESMPSEWHAFATDAARDAFQREFTGKSLPPSPSVLADSLQFTLSKLAPMGKPIVDVLLYCDVDGRKCPDCADGFSFKVVTMSFSNADKSGFFQMKHDPRSEAAV